MSIYVHVREKETTFYIMIVASTVINLLPLNDALDKVLYTYGCTVLYCTVYKLTISPFVVVCVDSTK